MQGFSIMNAPAPQLLRDYLIYLSTIKGRSPRTVEAYYNDLRLFLRYMMASRSGMPLPADDPNLESIPFATISNEMILGARLSDAYSFLAYVQSVNNNNAKTRARKVSSLRGFYKYLQSKTDLLEENPMEQLEIPAQRKSLPKYLTLEQSAALLQAVSGQNEKRDYAILMLFLNCGIRRSELVGLNLTDVYEDRIRVVGKGNKERIVYMGTSCRKAIDRYLEERNQIVLTDNKALFGSRDKNRISVSAVHRLVKKHLLESGLDATQFSAHKLRHTAATLMLANGVDLKTLQEVLGHENLNTTQIYTHIENTDKKIAAEANPLSKIKI